MNDWGRFIESVPWFLDSDATICVLETREGFQLPSSVAAVFPSLARLLGRSHLIQVSVNEVPYQLHVWDSANGQRMGWLCLTPDSNVPNNIQADHRELLLSFGGIVERFNEPDNSLLLDYDDVLTAREASHDASFINDYMWAFDDAGVDLPIRPSDYYALAREANGNTTLCHRVTGQVLLFAPDHAFDFVVPFAGCPEYTLYTINGVVALRDWVDIFAQQWLDHTE